MERKSILTVLLFILSWFYVLANSPETTVKGVVTNVNGEPVEFVLVSVENSNQATMTDEKGEYSLPVASGEHQLQFYHLNFENTEQAISLSTGEMKKVNVVLREDANLLSEVVVSGKSEKKEIETKGFAVNVIETKEASLQSITTNELLDRAAGVRVLQNGGLGSRTTYNLNGMSRNSVKIFINGIPAETYGASFSLNSIPPALIERVEVYKGVIPAHLSTDALGGAINVVLKKDMRSYLTASASYGSFNTLRSDFSALGRDAKTGLTARASGFYNYSDNDYEIWGKFAKYIKPNGIVEYVRAKRFHDAYRSYGGRVEVGYTDVKWADQFFVGYNGSDSYNEIQHGTYMSVPYMGRLSESQAHVFSLTYQKKNLFVDGLEFSVTGTHSRRNEVVTDTVPYKYNWDGEKMTGLHGEPHILTDKGAQQGSATLQHIDQNITTFRADLTYELFRNHKLTVNHIYMNVDQDEQDFMKSEVEREFLDTRDLRKNILSFSYEAKAFDNRLTASLFGKYYHQKIEKTDPGLQTIDGEKVKVIVRDSRVKEATGYGMATSYYILPELLVLFSAERAVRMPSDTEIFGSPSENVEENFDLKAEISDNFNLGFKAGSFEINKHRFDVSASFFIRDTKDKIVPKVLNSLNDAVQSLPNENIGKTKSQGFEAELHYAYGRNLRVGINASRFNLVDHTKFDSNGNLFDYYKQQLPNEPYFTANGNVQYTLHNLLQKRSMINLFYNCGFVHSFYTNRLEIEYYQVPNQFIQDVGVSYIFPGRQFVLSFDVKNIFNKEAYDNFAVQKPGRAFYLKLNYTINNF